MKRWMETIDEKTAGKCVTALAGLVLVVLAFFLAGVVTAAGAQTLGDLIDNQIKKLRDQDIPKPGMAVSCNLLVSPSHGKAGTNVLIRAAASSRERPLAGAGLTVLVQESGFYLREIYGEFDSGGTFEASWTVPERRDNSVREFGFSLRIADRQANTACSATRTFWYDEPPVISLDCGDPIWQLNKSYRVTADVKRVDNYTFTWLVDGNKVEERTGRMSSASSMVGPLPEGNHTMKVVVAGPYGTSEAECSRKVEVKYPRVIIKSATSKLGINESGEWCVQWEAYTDEANTLTVSIPETGHEETRTVSREGTGCFRYAFTKSGFFAVNLKIQNGSRGSIVVTGVSVHACPEGKKECRGGCIGQSDVCCLTGAAGSCPQGQQCCGDGCCGAGEVCDAAHSACCPAGSTFIADKGICCPGSAPAVCGDKCMPAGATCCTSYHCTGATNHVCCNDGKCCPSGTTCCADGGCCPTGRVCSANGGCSCPADRPVPCGPNCCASGQVCRDNQCAAACLPPACCAAQPVVCSSSCCAAGNVCCPDGHCCPAGGVCCNNGRCCPGGTICCADGGCCPAGTSCIPGGCTTPTGCPTGNPVQCGQACFPAGYVCCNAVSACPPGNSCCGDHCCPTGTACCGAGCCQAGSLCCPGATSCCPQLNQCCGTGCCPAGTVCRNGGCVQASSGIQGVQSVQSADIAPALPLIYRDSQVMPVNVLPHLFK